MSKPYEFAIRLRDLMSPAMQKLAALYEQRTTAMGRAWKRIEDLMARSTHTIVNLRSKLAGLGGSGFAVRVNTSDLDRANQKAGQFLDKLGRLREANGRFASTGAGPMGGGSTGGSVAALALGGFGGYVGMQAIRKAGEMTIGPAMERGGKEFMLGLLLKSKEQGAILSDRLAKFAADNPILGATEVFSSSQKLLASGFRQSEVIPELRMLGDLSAGSGTSLDALTYLYKQIKQNKIAQAQELNPLADYLPIYDALAAVLKVDVSKVRDMIEDRKVNFEMVQAALRSMTTGNGMFAGASEGLAKEPVGRYKQLVGNLQEKGLALGERMLPMVNKALDFLVEVMDKIAPLEKAFGVLGEGVGAVGKAVISLGGYFSGFHPQASGAEKAVLLLAGAVHHTGKILGIMGGALGWLVENPLAMAIVSVPLLKSAILGLNAAILATPLGAILGMGAAFYTAYEKFEWFRHVILDGWEGLKVFFNGLGEAIKLLEVGDFKGLAALSRRLDALAEERGNKAILNDKMARINERREAIGIADRKRGRESREKGGNANLSGLDFTKPNAPGGGGSLGDAAGLSSTVGNSKSNNITIHIKSLIENSGDINIFDTQYEISDLESKLVDALLRVANSGGRMVSA